MENYPSENRSDGDPVTETSDKKRKSIKVILEGLPELFNILTGISGIILFFVNTLIHGISGSVLNWIAVTLFAFGVHLELIKKVKWKYKHWIIPVTVMVLLTVYWLQPQGTKLPPSQPTKAASNAIGWDTLKTTPRTLHEWFRQDFKNYLCNSTYRTFYKQETRPPFAIKDSTKVDAELCEDFDARTAFLLFYIYDTPMTYDVCTFIARHCHNIFLDLRDKHVSVETSLPGSKPIDSSQLSFSPTIYIYNEYPLFESQKEQLEHLYKSLGLTLYIRDTYYMDARNSLLLYHKPRADSLKTSAHD